MGRLRETLANQTRTNRKPQVTLSPARKLTAFLAHSRATRGTHHQHAPSVMRLVPPRRLHSPQKYTSVNTWYK